MQADEQVASSSGSTRLPKEAKGCVKRKCNRKSARRSLRRAKQGNSQPKKPTASGQKTGRPRSTKQAKKTDPSEESFSEHLNLSAVAGRLTRRASKELAAQARAKQTTFAESSNSSDLCADRSEMQTVVDVSGDQQKATAAEERSREGEPKRAKHPSLAAEKAEENQPEQTTEESGEQELETRSLHKRHVADGANAGGEDQRDRLKEPEEKRSRSDSENVEKHAVDEGNSWSINALVPDENDPNVPGQNRRIETLERWNQCLMHASSCSVSNCGLTSCLNMKIVLCHTKLCDRRQDGNCPVCKQLIEKCRFHAKLCFERQCKVPYCLDIRQLSVMSHPAGVAGESLSQASTQLVSTASSAVLSANVNTADNPAGSSHSTAALPGHCFGALAVSSDDASRRPCDGAGSTTASSNVSQVRETVEAEVSSMQKEWREQNSKCSMFQLKPVACSASHDQSVGSTGRKEKRKSAAQKEKYLISQLVFASMKGYPPWPGRIQQPAEGRKCANRPYYVFFYGTHQTAWFAAKDLYPFDEYAATHGHPRPNNRGSKGFNVAMWELMNDADVQVDAPIPGDREDVLLHRFYRIPSDQAWAAALDAVKHGQAFLGLDEDDDPFAKRRKADTASLKEKESFPGTPGLSGQKETPGKEGRTGKSDKEKSAPRTKAPKSTLAVKIAPNGKRNQSVSEASCQDKPKLKRLGSVGGALVPAAKSARISLSSKRYDEAKCVTDKQHTVSFISAKPREGLNEVVEPNPTAAPDRNVSAAGSKESPLELRIIDAAQKQYRIPKIASPQKPASEKPSAEKIHKSERPSTIKPAASRGCMRTNAPVEMDSGIIKSNIASKESHVATMPLKGSSPQATPAAAHAAAVKQTASAGISVRKFSEDVAFAAAIKPEQQESVHLVADRAKQPSGQKVAASPIIADINACRLKQANVFKARWTASSNKDHKPTATAASGSATVTDSSAPSLGNQVRHDSPELL